MDPDKNKLQIKPPTTFKEQLELFKKRNMYIENPEFAEKVLQRVSYYRLSAYALSLKNPQTKDQFLKESSFNKMYSLYEFDRKLRLLLLGALELIEVAFRTHISYEIAHQFGPLGYQDEGNFINAEFHKLSMEELNTFIKKSRKGELFIEHHFKKYEGIIPIWAAIEVSSFGFLSKFYKNIDEEVKKNIAKTNYDVPYIYLESWLQTLSSIRNICAHYGRLYNKKLTFKPKLFKDDRKQFVNDRVFAAVYIIERLLTRPDGNRFIIDLEALILQYETSIESSLIGFPFNWKEILTKINDKKQY